MADEGEHARLHDDEVTITDELVRGLVTAQFPKWASLPLRRVRSSGTVNAIYRLGDDLVLRLPRTPAHARPRPWLEHNHTWLAEVAPLLPLEVPGPVALGEPTDDYPFAWPVHRWIDGDSLGTVDLAGSEDAATRLGELVRTLHASASPGPGDGAPRSAKAISRRTWDPVFRKTIEGVRGIDGIDVDAAIAAWDATLSAAAWGRPAVWVHGDLLRDNLLARDGRLVAVIDWECWGAGEPALDLTPAWFVFRGEARAAFVAAVGADADTWARARNLALRSVMGIRYYEHTNPAFSAMALQTLIEATADPIA